MKKQIKLSTLLLSLLMLLIIGCSDSGNSTSALQQNEKDKAQKVDKQKQLVNTKWKFTAYIDEVNNTKEEPEDRSFRTDEGGLIIEFTENKTSEHYDPAIVPNKDVYEIKGYGYWDEHLTFIGLYNFDKDRDNGIKLGISQPNKILEPKDAYKFYDLVNKTHSFDATKDNLKLYYGEGKDKYLLFNKLTPKIEKN